MSRADPLIIQAAIDLIDTPEKWIKGTFAKTAGGFQVSPTDEGATCFCMSGALIRVTRRWDQFPEKVLLRTILDERIPDWNDAPERTHSEVMEVMYAAKAQAEEAQA